MLRTTGPPQKVQLRRFGSAFTVSAGTLEPGAPMVLVIPRDTAPDPWYVSPSAALEVCGTPA